MTTRRRAEFVKAVERKERLLRGFGFALCWAGLAAAAYGLSVRLGWPRPFAGRFAPETAGAASLAAILLLLPFWVVHVYNRCVQYRVRVENAWRQIDVDSKMRYELIPRLSDVLKGYLAHERSLLERLAALRTCALAGRFRRSGRRRGSRGG